MSIFNIEQYLVDRVISLRVRQDVVNGMFSKIEAHRDDDAYVSDVAGWKRRAMIETNKITGAYSELYALARAFNHEIVLNKEDNTFVVREVSTTVEA